MVCEKEMEISTMEKTSGPKEELGTGRKKARKIHVGTRKSALALAQAEIVLTALRKAHPEIEFEIHAMSTMGDNDQVTALSQFGTKSLWTNELETLLKEEKLDIIVHSLKDMPTQLPDKCIIGCILEREDPRDVVIMKKGSSYTSLSELPIGAVVGTSSLRRSSQVNRLYPHLKLKDIRGNVGTRLSKLDDMEGDYACIILAAAGIKRMGWQDRITNYLDSNTTGGHYYAVGQGALAIETREGDNTVLHLLSVLSDQDSTLSTSSERSLMRALEGGCSVPIGVESTWVKKGELMIKAIVVSLDGTKSVETVIIDQVLTINDAEEFGKRIAKDLMEKGAGEILDEIKGKHVTSQTK